jgi:NADH dehydrogenase FAD-containing subunit
MVIASKLRSRPAPLRIAAFLVILSHVFARTSAFSPSPRIIGQARTWQYTAIMNHETVHLLPRFLQRELYSERRKVSDSVMTPPSPGDNDDGDEDGRDNFQITTIESLHPQEQDHFILNGQSEGMDPVQQDDDQTSSQDDEEERAAADRYLKLLSTEVGVKKLLGLPTKPAVLPIDVLLGRTLDTVEDVVTHVRRIPYDWGWVEAPMERKQKTVVVLGSGWAAHAIMKVANTYDIRMIVVSPVNHFVFTPMLAAAAVGTVEYRSMTEAVRASNPMIEFLEGKAVNVNVEEKTITVELISLLEDVYKGCPPPDPIELHYDTLICAVGTQVKTSMVPGAGQHCYYLKSCEDSRRLRAAIGEAFEYASRPDVAGPAHQEERRRRVTFCIVGGGPTGVELAGELSDFFGDICQPRKGAYPRLADDVKVLLVHGGSQLVEAFDTNLRDHAVDALQRRGVEVRLNTYTTQVDNGFVKLKDKITGIEETIPVGITVWAAGNEPVPFCKKLLEQLPAEAMGPGGRINVDRWLRPPTKNPETMGSIFLLGDAACFDEGDTDGSSSSSLLPQTAQVAGQQGAYVARLLNRNYNMTTTPPALPQPGALNVTETEIDALLETWLHLRGLDEASAFRFLNLGLLAYVGGGEALSQIQLGNIPVFSYAGSVAFVLWRSVYLVKQVATRNRVLVTFDWIKTALFGRDVTRL